MEYRVYITLRAKRRLQFSSDDVTLGLGYLYSAFGEEAGLN